MDNVATCPCGHHFVVPEDLETTVCPQCGKIVLASHSPVTLPAKESSPAGTPTTSRRPIAVMIVVGGLLVFGIPLGVYWQAASQVRTLEGELQQWPQHRQERLAAVQKEELDRQLMLVVTGPAAVQPGAANEYQIETRSLSNKPLPARLHIRVVDEADNVVHEEKNLNSSGSYRLSLPRPLASTQNTTLTLEIIARAPPGVAQSWLREKLPLTGPVYVTHLATDKPLYQPGEVVSFRSLTLERGTLQPPDAELQLVYTLTNGSGEKVFELEGTAFVSDRQQQVLRGPDHKPIRGVGAGEYAIPVEAKGGEYILSVREASGLFPPQTRTFLVNRYEKPRLHKELEWLRRSYGPGERATALCRVARVEGGRALANQTVTATVQIDGQRYQADGTPSADAVLTARTDSQGAVQIPFTLPTRIERGEASLSVQFQDGGNIETLVRPIPIVLKKLRVDFFPEGGDLVAGISNRVYFQARTTLDRPAEMKGRIVNGRGQTVADVQTQSDDSQPSFNQGLGCVVFTPRAGENYALAIDHPADIAERSPLPVVRREGVGLSIPEGVSGGQEPIRAIVHSAGKDRRLLVGAYGRGRLLDHREVDVRQGQATEVRLLPRMDVGGIYRVTVFECGDPRADRDPLRPVAERLVYRKPQRSLQLDLQTDKPRYVPGDRVRLNCTARTEQGQPAPALLMLAVVDQRVLTLADEKTARTMPTHFQLGTEVRRPEDLEHADVLLADQPRSAEALDLLLGTQGWRRFVEQAPEHFRQRHPGEGERLLASIGQAPLQVNNFVEVQRSSQVEIDKKLQAVNQQVWNEEQLLRKKQRAAQDRLHGFEDFGSALLSLVIVVVVAAPIMLLIVSVVIAFKDLAESIPRQKQTVTQGSSLTSIAVLVSLFLVVCLAAVSTLGSNASGKFNTVAQTIGSGTPGAGMPQEAARPHLFKHDRAPAQVREPMEAKAPPPMDAPLLAVAPPVVGVDQSAGEARPGSRRAGERVFVSAARAGGSARNRFEEAARAQQHRPVGQPRSPQVGRQFSQEMSRPAEPHGQLLVVREYAHEHAPGPRPVRSDFTETLFWHPVLVLPDGSASVSFDLCDSVTRFQATAFGHTLDGRLGAGTTTLESRLPFSIEPKFPIEVTAGDRIDIPVTIANDTDTRRAIRLNLQHSGLHLLQGNSDEQFSLDANQRARRLYRLRPALQEGAARLRLDGRCEPFEADSIERSLAVVPDGFPIVGSHSDVLKNLAQHEIILPEQWSPGSLQVEAKLFPSILADLQTGLDSLLREPHGCFEQTSSSNYPNLLVLDYLKENNQARPEVVSRVQHMLDRGYQKLISFECVNTSKQRREGYEWFGGTAPPHEALTAYGLLQFRDLARVYDRVDMSMVERTRRYLLSRRDGKGGFQLNPRSLDRFGGASAAITNAYIVWALTESGKEDDLETELAALVDQARSSRDSYFLALAANSLLNRGRAAEASSILEKLTAAQTPDGAVGGAQTSITRSGGRDLLVETTSLAVLAWVKANPPGRTQQYRGPLQSALRWLGQQRGGFGGFGATQATILALKAFLATDRARKAANAGEVALYVGDRPLVFQRFTAAVQDAITLRLPDPDKHLKPGTNHIRLDLARAELPYTLTWSYRTRKPPSAADCSVRLRTRLERGSLREGDTVRMTATVENLLAEDQGMAVAIIGLPAGLTIPEDMKQLKELARPPLAPPSQGGERGVGSQPGVISAWETRGRELILYWRALAPSQKIDVHLDLIARVPGEYRGPASRAYLYYNPDHKCWDQPLEVKIQAIEE